MASLSPEGEDLAEAGRAALRADAGDMARIETALRQRLGPTAFGPVGAATPLAGKGLLVTLAATSALLVGGVTLLLGDEDKPLARSAPAPVAASTPERAPLPLQESAPADSEPPKSAPVTRPASPQREASPSGAGGNPLAQEVALLSQASSAFRGGRPAEALRTLAEHQRRFPNGVLAQERAAARVQALCALGRRTEGLAELGRLSKRWPGSPLEATARRACGAEGER